MNKAIIICAFLAIAFSSTFNDKPTLVASSNNNLGFNDLTGPGATQAMIISLTNFANSASSFFKDDVAANAKYIKVQMDKTYGDDSLNFFVLIQTEQVRSSFTIIVTP